MWLNMKNQLAQEAAYSFVETIVVLCIIGMLTAIFLNTDTVQHFLKLIKNIR
jgi:competence protein ComGC